MSECPVSFAFDFCACCFSSLSQMNSPRTSCKPATRTVPTGKNELMDKRLHENETFIRTTGCVWNRVRAENLTMLCCGRKSKRFFPKNISKHSWQLDFLPNTKCQRRVGTSGSPSFLSLKGLSSLPSWAPPTALRTNVLSLSQGR